MLPAAKHDKRRITADDARRAVITPRSVTAGRGFMGVFVMQGRLTPLSQILKIPDSPIAGAGEQ
jgi:hypothetical protein